MRYFRGGLLEPEEPPDQERRLWSGRELLAGPSEGGTGDSGASGAGSSSGMRCMSNVSLAPYDCPSRLLKKSSYRFQGCPR